MGFNVAALRLVSIACLPGGVPIVISISKRGGIIAGLRRRRILLNMRMRKCRRITVMNVGIIMK